MFSETTTGYNLPEGNKLGESKLVHKIVSKIKDNPDEHTYVKYLHLTSLSKRCLILCITFLREMQLKDT